jgi:hypothetical protein
MIVFTGAGVQLVSPATALALIKVVISDYYGPDELAAQEPLKVDDGGAVWKITGSRARKRYESGPLPPPFRSSTPRLSLSRSDPSP